MTKIINFQEALRKKSFDKLFSDIENTNNRAWQIANKYYQLMQKDPSQAIKQFDDYMERVRDVNPGGSFVETIAGGPNQDWTTPLMNIIGIMYPTLDKELRTEGLKKCMYYLDHLRYDYSQNHVELINEPWLVSDIVISRPLYWCGFQDYIQLLEKHKEWDGFRKDLNNVKSDFWLTYTVVRPEHSSLDIRANYYKEYPEIVDRTLDGIAAILEVRAQHNLEKENKPLQETYDKSLPHVDTLLHDRILKKIEEKKWIQLPL